VHIWNNVSLNYYYFTPLAVTGPDKMTKKTISNRLQRELTHDPDMTRVPKIHESLFYFVESRLKSSHLWLASDSSPGHVTLKSKWSWKSVLILPSRV